ncbi:HAD-like domain-containing protein, partial [Baffinella frigidus]
AASESDSDLDDDFGEDFDPFEFIKKLSTIPVESMPCALPKKTRNSPAVSRTHASFPPGQELEGVVSLVLDLDETLVHASLEFMEDAHLTFNVNFHSQDYTVWVKIRPHCIEFLERLADKFELIVFTASQFLERLADKVELIVFTASQRIYADKLLNLIDPERKYFKH